MSKLLLFDRKMKYQLIVSPCIQFKHRESQLLNFSFGREP